ncbi:hypothetical protein Taro_046092 [Colocasia esculenta]|uniref:Dof zinc finger protein n=1 Tax=Colocasia esculenta TaxID=4460 RepID=A0A843X738_COLES|nr:hypothetical protein [Colocasia esculenta]
MHDPGAAAIPLVPLLQEEHQQQLRCPRCDSTNTKFCYYNNYNLSQPRHFCRDCRRYWTRGGALRNVPVGGGTRKSSKRGASSSSSPSSSSSTSPSKRSNTLSSSPPPPAAVAPAAPLSTPPLQMSTTDHVSALRLTSAVFSTPGATDLGRPIGDRPSVELQTLGAGGKAGAPPPRTPAHDDIVKLQGDSNWRKSGGGWSDLSIFTPGSKYQ